VKHWSWSRAIDSSRSVSGKLTSPFLECLGQSIDSFRLFGCEVMALHGIGWTKAGEWLSYTVEVS